MLELRKLQIGIIRVLACAEVIDGLAKVGSGISLRLSSGEALVLCCPVDTPRLLERVHTQLVQAEPTAVALSDSASFSCWTLGGRDADEAFSRLSAIPLPGPRPSFVQGLVTHIPARVLAGSERLIILVSSTLEHHLQESIHKACRDLNVSEREPEALSPKLLAEVAT